LKFQCLFLVTNEILKHQSLTHGLFPLDTSETSNGDGHVRDNVYCAMCIWTLGLAYRYPNWSECIVSIRF